MMTMLTKPHVLALIALLACSACADRSQSMKRSDAGQAQQYSSIRWDEATAATYAVRVGNSNLIMMR